MKCKQQIRARFWTRRTDLASQRWQLRIMAEAEGYVMVRFKGNAPFLLSIKELERDYFPDLQISSPKPKHRVTAVGL